MIKDDQASNTFTQSGYRVPINAGLHEEDGWCGASLLVHLNLGICWNKTCFILYTSHYQFLWVLKMLEAVLIYVFGKWTNSIYIYCNY